MKIKLKLRWSVCLMTSLLWLSNVSLAQEVHTFSLDNGLKVLVKEDHRAPVVVSQIWYKVGSIDEIDGKTGLSHVLEHMMFKGTETTKPGEFSALISKAGGSHNAFTSADYTMYYQKLHKKYLGLAFELEADRMGNLNITPEEFEKEMKVVMEERRTRVDDSPTSQLHEEFYKVNYSQHPYRLPTIGFMHDLENLTYEDAQNWYDKWYAPNNALIVVVGDVKPHEVFELAKQHFGKIKEKVLPVREIPFEPKQNEAKRIVVKATAKLPYLRLGFHAPTANTAEDDWEPYALHVLDWILTANSASRLDKSLVKEQKKALSVDSGYSILNRGRTANFNFYARPFKKVSIQKLETALLAEIDKIKQGGVTDSELKRVKAGIETSNIYKRDSMYSQASAVGRYETIGVSWDFGDQYLAKVEQVTSEQIQAVAKRYFTKENMTVAELKPQPPAN